ncbi:unnamed protein product [Enterobius vermicularis]|uniref:Uncharacterized protein n=1 Tax=Enterobius vermicularis TaxID=51028 RepID=A0A0N4VG23_ENTVE|nr:unnamed protein product [Enterobius vermicularis]
MARPSSDEKVLCSNDVGRIRLPKRVIQFVAGSETGKPNVIPLPPYDSRGLLDTLEKVRLRVGRMARLAQDQRVACSNDVGVSGRTAPGGKLFLCNAFPVLEQDLRNSAAQYCLIFRGKSMGT